MGSSHSFFIVSTLALFLLSCGTTDPPSTRNTMQAVIDGKTWTATEVEASREGNRIVVEGSSAIGTVIRLVFDADTVGTYRLGEGRSEAVLIDEFTEWTAYGFGSGSGIISEIDGERIAGSFGFQGDDTSGIASDREIASGKFDVDFAP